MTFEGFFQSGLEEIASRIEAAKEPPSVNVNDRTVAGQDAAIAADLEQTSAQALPTATLPSSANVEAGDTTNIRESLHNLNVENTNLIRVRTTVRQASQPTCRCQCHKSTRIESPWFMQNLLGSFFLHYNTHALWDSAKCSHPTCLADTPSRLVLSYVFLPWLWQRAVNVTAMAGGIHGPGPNIHLRVPRVIEEDHEVWGVVEHAKLARLQYLVSTKDFLPTNVDASGMTVLNVRCPKTLEHICEMYSDANRIVCSGFFKSSRQQLFISSRVYYLCSNLTLLLP